jgi:hypothetical protein
MILEREELSHARQCMHGKVNVQYLSPPQRPRLSRSSVRLLPSP